MGLSRRMRVRVPKHSMRCVLAVSGQRLCVWRARKHATNGRKHRHKSRHNMHITCRNVILAIIRREVTSMAIEHAMKVESILP